MELANLTVGLNSILLDATDLSHQLAHSAPIVAVNPPHMSLLVGATYSLSFTYHAAIAGGYDFQSNTLFTWYVDLIASQD